jgi:hypothetical protein
MEIVPRVRMGFLESVVWPWDEAHLCPADIIDNNCALHKRVSQDVRPSAAVRDCGHAKVCRRVGPAAVNEVNGVEPKSDAVEDHSHWGSDSVALRKICTILPEVHGWRTERLIDGDGDT